MSDEPINRNPAARRALMAAAWACLAIALIGDFAGVLDRVVPPHYGIVFPREAFALVILAYRRPGPRGWVVVLLCWAGVAVATYYQLTR
jgi:hypothetical protein